MNHVYKRLKVLLEKPGSAVTGFSNSDGRFALHMMAFLMVLTLFVSIGCDESPAAGYAVEVESKAITIIDDLGRTIELKQPASRIVAGSSFAVELLMVLDHPPVLRPDVSERKAHPVEALTIPTFTIQHGTGPNVETITAAQPDLVILHVNFAAFAVNIEQSVGIPVVLLEIRSVGDVTNKLKLLGQITGKQEKAKQQVAAFNQQIKNITQTSCGESMRVLAVFGTPEAFYAFRKTSYIGSMLQLLRVENVSGNDEALNNLRSIAPLNFEQALGRSPHAIVIIPHGPPEAVMNYIAAHPAWSEMQAVHNKRVYLLDEVLFSSNPGPRAPEAINKLKHLLCSENP